MTSQNPRDHRDWMRNLERNQGKALAIPAIVNQAIGEVIEGVEETNLRHPAAPVELNAQTMIYADPTLRQQVAILNLDFPNVTFNTDGTDAVIQQYELWGYQVLPGDEEIPDSEKPWSIQVTNQDSDFTYSPYDPGSLWMFRARAIGIDSIQPGEWSEDLLVQMVADTVPPPQPTAPTVVASRGTLTVKWDGLSPVGPMPLDLDYVVLARGTASSPTTEVTRFSASGGFVVFSDAEYRVVEFFRLRAVDYSGNVSPWSEQATGFTTPLVDVDIILSELDAGKVIIKNANKILLDAEVELGTKLAENDTALADNKTAVEAAQADVEATKAEVAAIVIDVDAVGTALATVDAKADAAVADASAANTAAGEAQTAAGAAKADALAAVGIANDKGKVLVQPTAPGAGDRNANTLWIDTTGGLNTPKRWVSDTTWAAVTDKVATDAAAAVIVAKQRADDAFNKAVDAATAAGNALTAANGKTRNWHQATKPAGTGHNVNDTWFKSPENLIHRWNGSDWVSIQDTDIAGAKSAADDAAAAAVIADGKAVAAQSKANTAQAEVDAAEAKIAAAEGQINTAKADIVKAKADIIAAASAASTADGKAVAAQAKANTAQAEVDALEGKVVTVEGSLSSLTTSVNGKNAIINAVTDPVGSTTDRVDGDRWQKWDTLNAGGKLLASWRYTGTVWRAELMDSTYLPQVDIGAGTFGSLGGDRLKVGSVLADRVIIGGSANALPDPSFQSPEINALRMGLSAGGAAGWTLIPGTTTSLRKYERTTASNNDVFSYATQSPAAANRGSAIQVVGGQQWVMSVDVETAISAGVRFNVYRWKSDGTADYTSLSPYDIGVGRRTLTYSYLIPDGITAIAVLLACNTSGVKWGIYGNAVLALKASGVMIEDGAITADKIFTKSITAAEIKAGSLTSVSGIFGTIDASIINAGTLNADRLNANDIRAKFISVGKITALELAVDSVTASQIAANAVTAVAILAKSITANEIKAGTITSVSGVFGAVDANILTAGTINAARLNAGDIRAKFLSAGKITAADMVTGTITATSGIIGSLDGDVIVANSIKGISIAAKTIRAESLAIGNFDNLIAEPDFTNGGASWVLGTGRTIVAGQGRSGGPVLRMTGTGGINSSYNEPQRRPIDGGTSWRISAWVRSSVNAPADSSWLFAATYTTSGASRFPLVSSPALVAGQWTLISGVLKSSDIETTASFAISTRQSFPVGATLDFDFVSVTRMGEGKLIVDGSVTAKQMTIGSYDNLLDDPSFEAAGASPWELGAGTVIQTDAGRDGKMVLRSNIGRSTSVAAKQTPVQLKAGDKYVASMWLYVSAATTANQQVRMTAWYKTRAGSSAGSAGVIDVPSGVGTGWKFYESSTITVPANAEYAEIQMNVTTDFAGLAIFDDAKILKQTPGALIVNGSITSSELATDSVTAAAIKAGTITATEIATNAITTAKINAGAITTTELATNSVTAAKIVGLTITANEMAANSITAGKINVDAVTAREIKALTITAAQLAANTITADKINVGSISAVILTADVVTSALLKSDAITVKHTITAAKYQTTTASNRGLQIDASGLKAWDSAGNQTVDINAATGFATIAGRFRSAMPGQPGVVIVPSAESDDGTTMGVWFAPNVDSIPGQITGGIWTSKLPTQMISTYQLHMRGANGGGVKIWNDLEIQGVGSLPAQIVGAGGLTLQTTGTQAVDVVNSGYDYTMMHKSFGGAGCYNGYYLNGNHLALIGAGSRFGNHAGIEALDRGIRLITGAGYNISAPAMYNRTSGNAANIHVGSDGALWRSTSALKYKAMVAEMELPKTLLDVKVKDWRDKLAAERYADAISNRPIGCITESESAEFDAIDISRIPGAIAEEVLEAGGGSFVQYGPDGEVEGLMYDRFTLARTQLLNDKLNAAIERIEELEARLGAV